ncbi:MAG: flagellar hook-associated family protein [Alphaproteobacteria bacterium]|jgi:flagellar hook-associated protein 3 FlgL|nr:MAG: flagellar hook-associated family protein [Alphaproteobacteria bacterium]
MKTTFTSTSAISEVARLTIMKLQSQLVEAQKEVATGRYADVGATLGSRTGQSVSLRQEETRLQAIIDSNGLVATRLDASQSALKSISDDAQTYLDQLISSRTGDVQHSIEGEARNGLKGLIGTLNTQIDGAYLFAGTNADAKPIVDYEQSPPSASQQAVDAAFVAAFGFPSSDPQVANISASDMQTFLDTSFADLFKDPAWKNTWSQASDQNVRSRISSSELIDTSASANDDAIRKLVSAHVMVAALGTANLNQSAYQEVIDHASTLTSEAIQGLTTMQADLGSAQQRVTDANSRMTAQADIITNHIGALEGVDPYEASTRLSSLMTQIETAYSMTARIEKLTLLNYLPI